MSRPLQWSVGAAGAAILALYVPQFEGMILRGYRDPIGVVTACAGHTKTAVLGRPYTREECERFLVEDLAEHAEGAMSCVDVALDTGRSAAAVSFAFNVGVAAFCGSTFAKRLNENDPNACEELDRWVFAGGQRLPGLVTRRATERAICEGRIG